MNKTTSIGRSAHGQHLYDSLENLPSSKRFTRDQLELIYALAHAHIVQRQYDRALPIFAFLAQYGPTRRHYLYGLALSLQMLGRLDEAIGMYSLCTTLFPGSFEATQRIAQCHVGAGRRDDACRTLESLLREAQTGDNLELERRAQGMLSLITKRDPA